MTARALSPAELALVDLALAASCCRRPGLNTPAQAMLVAALGHAAHALDRCDDRFVPAGSPLNLLRAALDHCIGQGVSREDIGALVNRHARAHPGGTRAEVA